MRQSIYLKLAGLLSVWFFAAVCLGANNIPNIVTNNIKVTGQTASQVAIFDVGKNLTSSGVTSTTLSLLNSATSANTASQLVLRDGSGNFSAGTITATLTGNASSATTAAAVTGLATTAGGVIISNGSGLVNTGTGSGGQVLISAGSGNAGWGAVQAGALGVRSVTTTDSCTAADNVLLLSGSSFTENLVTAVGNKGLELILVHEGTSLTNVYTLTPNASEKINFQGSALSSVSLYTVGERWGLVSDNVGWRVLFHDTDTTWTNAGTMSVTNSSSYTFTISSSSITIGWQYTNNGNTYTATQTTASSTTITMGGTGAPLAATSTLTCIVASGCGGNLTYTALSSSTPAYGAGDINNLWWRRVGQNAEFRWELKQTAAGTAGTGQHMFYNSSFIVDINKVTSQQINLVASGLAYPVNTVGSFTAEMSTSSSVLAGSVYVFGNTSGTFFLMAGTGGSSSTGIPSVIGSGYITLSGNPMSLSATMSVPIVNWLP